MRILAGYLTHQDGILATIVLAVSPSLTQQRHSMEPGTSAFGSAICSPRVDTLASVEQPMVASIDPSRLRSQVLRLLRRASLVLTLCLLA